MYYAGKLLMDALHGGIPCNHLEISVIDHPLMQRLRHVLQNDVLHYSFQGATHNRFSHSIGAMHISGQLYDCAIKNTLTGFRKLPADPNSRETRAIDYFRQAVRLAVLLHDTGHGPFSHQAERSPSLKAILSTREGAFSEMWEGIPDVVQHYPVEPVELHHEHYSVRMAYEILSQTEGVEKSLCHDVMSLLDSTEKTPSAVFLLNLRELPDPLRDMIGSGHEAAINWMKVLSSIVSGVMDADRLDYLMRDTLYTGAKYADLSLDLICNSLAFFRDSEDWFGLIVREQAVGAVEDFLHARMRMYRQVYQHKTARGSFGFILHSAIEEVMSRQSFSEKVFKYAKSPKNFFALNDNLFWSEFTDYAMEYPMSMCARLVYREPVKHLVTLENPSADEVKETKESLAAGLSVSPEQIVIMRDSFRFAPRPGEDKADKLRILNKHPLKKGAAAIPLHEKMPLYDTFAEGCEIYTFLYHSPKKSSR